MLQQLIPGCLISGLVRKNNCILYHQIKHNYPKNNRSDKAKRATIEDYCSLWRNPCVVDSSRSLRAHKAALSRAVRASLLRVFILMFILTCVSAPTTISGSPTLFSIPSLVKHSHHCHCLGCSYLGTPAWVSGNPMEINTENPRISIFVSSMCPWAAQLLDSCRRISLWTEMWHRQGA